MKLGDDDYSTTQIFLSCSNDLTESFYTAID